MIKSEVEYVTKADCIEAGFVKLPGKCIQKLSTLELYATKGYLDFGSKNFNSNDRVNAGHTLAADYYLGGLNQMSAVNPEKIRVDGGGSIVGAEKKAFHEDRFRKAIRVIPREFLAVVHHVVIEDKPIKVVGTDREVNKKLFLLRVDLCRGLDRLIKFYLQGH